VERRHAGAHRQAAQQKQDGDRKRQRGPDALQGPARCQQVGGAGRRVHVSETDHQEGCGDATCEKQSQAEVRPPEPDEHHAGKGSELEAGPQGDEIARGRGNHHAESREQRHRQADGNRIFGGPIGNRDGGRRRQERGCFDEQGEPVLYEATPEKAGQRVRSRPRARRRGRRGPRPRRPPAETDASTSARRQSADQQQEDGCTGDQGFGDEEKRPHDFSA
jgi:hypothetical protein